MNAPAIRLDLLNPRLRVVKRSSEVPRATKAKRPKKTPHPEAVRKHQERLRRQAEKEGGGDGQS